jgi:myo-inositol 2-dehydrogenase / D-chiro-inositol 1-dehydrogenase
MSTGVMTGTRIGFIGAGNHAAWTLYPTLQYFPAARLACVCDLDAKRAEQVGGNFGARAFYTRYTEMMDRENIDALFCCGGPKLHAEVIREAIRRRIPLFVEKPPASTADELRGLAQEADKAGSLVQVAFMHRFAPVTAWAHKVTAKPEFGKAMMVFAREGLWGMDREHMVMDSGIHNLDLMRAFCGDVEWVRAVRVSDGGKRHAVAATMMFRNGILGQLNLNSLESLTTPSDIVEIHGDRGGFIRIDNWSRVSWIRDPGPLFSPSDDPRDGTLSYEHGWTGAGTNRSTVVQGYRDEMAHFFSSLEKGERPTPGLWDGYRAVQLVEAINRGIATGERVSIE